MKPVLSAGLLVGAATPAEAVQRWLILTVLVLLLLLVGAALILALRSAWRNQEHRAGLVERGRRLRAESRGEVSPRDRDVWRESGRRLLSRRDVVAKEEAEQADGEMPGPQEDEPGDPLRESDDDDEPPQR